MSRHVFAALLIAVLGIASLQEGAAATTCQNTPNGELCVSSVDLQRFAQQAFQTQQASQWCWAASIAMIFAYHDSPVSQARIVSEVYGSPVDMPAQAGVVMAQQLNRQWLDDNGQPFAARLTGLYDAYAGVYGLTNAQIVNELAAGNPLLLANRTHAVVLSSVQYYRTSVGPQIIAGNVFDPWPGIGSRPLGARELMGADTGVGDLTFVAMASVVPIRPLPGDGVGSGASGGGGSSDLGTLLFLVVSVIALKVRRAGDRLVSFGWR